ncbi:MAG: GNAT family N-acetyltransferase [Leptospirales bacterium]
MILTPVDKNSSDFDLVVMLDTYIFTPPWTKKQWIQEIYNESNRLYLATTSLEDGVPMGFLSFGIAGEAIELKKIGVATEFRARGIGSQMLDFLIKEAKRLEVDNILGEVAITNKPALKLYKKFAFHKISVRKRYYAGLIDAIVLQKEI